MYYCVITIYHNKHIKKIRIKPVDLQKKPQNYYDEDIETHYEWFDTLKEANEYVNGCLLAKKLENKKSR